MKSTEWPEVHSSLYGFVYSLCKIINSTSSIGFKKNVTVEQCSDEKSGSSPFWFMIKYKDYVINSAPGSELLPVLYSDMAGSCTISCAYITIPV